MRPYGEPYPGLSYGPPALPMMPHMSAPPPIVFGGYAGPVVPGHMVYNGFGQPVGAIPLIAALAPLAAQVIGSLIKRRPSPPERIDGFHEYDDGLGLYAGIEPVPTQIVVNGLGEPVGAIPLI